MDVAQSWIFGLDEDDTSKGIASMIESINARLSALIDVLHDESELDFERDDVDE